MTRKQTDPGVNVQGDAETAPKPRRKADHGGPAGSETGPGADSMMGDWPANAIERRRLSELIPYARNARTHSDVQVAQIASSMREWGWTMPILIDDDDNIIAGHGRILGAALLGWEFGPCMIAKGWSEAKRRAYVIADNKLAQNASWDVELLGIELTDLVAEGFAVELIGFTAAEMETTLAGWNYEMQQRDIAAGDELDIEVIKVRCHIGEKERVITLLRTALDAGDYGHVRIS
jgi:ParB-like chromosome segregation protein Spo0J